MKQLPFLASLCAALVPVAASAAVRVESTVDNVSIMLTGISPAKSIEDYFVPGQTVGGLSASIFNTASDWNHEYVTAAPGATAISLSRANGGTSAASREPSDSPSAIGKMTASFTLTADRSQTFGRTSAAQGRGTAGAGLSFLVPVGATITISGIATMLQSGNHPLLKDGTTYADGYVGLGLWMEGMEIGERLADEFSMSFEDSGTTPFSWSGIKGLSLSYTNLSGADRVVRASASVSASGTGYLLPSVPEPSTYALMFVGLAAVGLVARRRTW